MEVDARRYGGELEKLIVRQRQLDTLAKEAASDAAAAKAGLDAAKDADIGADVKAILDGGDGADERSEPAAAEARRLADRNLVVADRARLANLDRMAAEAQDSKYVKKISTEEERLVKAALAAVNTLEKILDDIGELRAARNWLERPSDGQRMNAPIRFSGIWCGSERTRQPNGDAARSSELTQAVREALLGSDRDTRPAHETYGLPVGAVMTGLDGYPVPPTPGKSEAFRQYAEATDAGGVSGEAAARLLGEQVAEWKAKPPAKVPTEA